VNRRSVRVTDEFYNDLDSYLGPERGANGEPSAADFIRFELLPLIDIIAERFDDLPEALPGHPEYRVLINTGRLVPRISIMGMLQADGSVELIQLDLDLEGPDGP
jgi:hypothetical protein